MKPEYEYPEEKAKKILGHNLWIILFAFLFFCCFQAGRYITKEHIRNCLLTHKKGAYTSIAEVEVGIDALGQIRDERGGK